MKRTALALTVISSLLFSVAAGAISVNLTLADPIVHEHLPYITINRYGTVTPNTELIKHTGNVYTLTTNLTQTYTITIECSNIVFDGAGHSINCSFPYWNPALKLIDVTNVKVKNLEAYSDNTYDITLRRCSNCTIQNVNTAGKDVYLVYSNLCTIADSDISIGFDDSNNNVFVGNNITEIHISGGSSNTLYKNNIFCNISTVIKPGSYLVDSANFWDNGSMGNYWNDYLMKYPNASEIGNSGIGDTPYVINANNVDNYPLTYPDGIEKNTTTLPTQEPQPEPFPITLVGVASGASALAVGVGLLVYFKKRKQHQNSIKE